ncbi:site-specific integrase [Pseudomonas sp. CFBP 8770]|uniref:tyrosine-type recombinase/integrase n=1 Tax=unclassified Pseudomonas TaxID=196821 RepID=UPI00177CD01F|nr:MULTISPECIES: site-specific integrase [unclassified Pseudomonas]MBD8472497.1 site-specific integrase [Pseudomonas sp. CFBP 8773]MBD8649286.1 site-specific integrase [Pseudomonas sp. CFBP 8770]
MTCEPKPLFETFESFVDQDFLCAGSSVNYVQDYINAFPAELRAGAGYEAVRSFLRAYDQSEQTYTSYRTHVERLLLWATIVQKKSIFELRRQDAEAYLSFCRNPPINWVGSVTRSRFVPNKDAETAIDFPLVPNEKWKPFSQKRPKNPAFSNVDLPYSASTGTMNQVFSVCSSFYEFLAEGCLVSLNPFRMVKNKQHYTGNAGGDIQNRALTPLQWDYVLETAEEMASLEPSKHRRTLFVLSTLFAMYLRISDLVGRANWQPTMGDFRQDPEGNWWYHVIGKGDKVGKIAVRNEYIDQYLKRYRVFLGLSELPSENERTPLLCTLDGRAGLSGRQVRTLLQSVFDNALAKMKTEGREGYETNSLRAASAHWLRHTSATFDAPFRKAKDLQLDLRHSNLSTTQDTYYHSHDQERVYSIKRLGMRDRG